MEVLEAVAVAGAVLAGDSNFTLVVVVRNKEKIDPSSVVAGVAGVAGVAAGAAGGAPFAVAAVAINPEEEVLFKRGDFLLLELLLNLSLLVALPILDKFLPTEP